MIIDVLTGRRPLGTVFGISVLFLAIILSCVIAHAETGTFVHQESAQALFEEGMRLRELGDLNNAEWHIKRALEIFPGNADYRFELANIYAIQYDRLGKKRVKAANRKMLKYAEQELYQATMVNPDFVAAHFNLGVVLKKQGRYAEARQKFKHVLEYDSNIVNAYLQIAETYEKQGFFDEAKDAYMEARELDYGNREIQSSIEDLEQLREEDHERMLRDDYRGRMSRYGRFEYTPGSHGERLTNQQINSFDNDQGIVGAVPYLAFWLVDQFMQLKEEE